MSTSAGTAPSALAGGRLTIDLAALAANWRALAGRAAPARAGAVIKGDGYGIGDEAAARALAVAGCETFFVALPEEGFAVRKAVPQADIYVLDGLLPGSAAALAAARLRPILGSLAEIEEWAAFASGGDAASAIHVDTGMNRLGLTLDEARALAGRTDLLAAIRPALLVSHLAAADTPGHPLNARQLARFHEARALFPGMPASLANSAGIALGPDYHFDLVRPGVALYGAAPGETIAPLETVVTLETRILQVREVPPGDTVGYGAARTLSRPSRIAIAGTGYADGYHRQAGSHDGRPGAEGVLHGRRVPIAGRVSMDLTAFDVTDVPGAMRGDWIELFGPNMPIDEVAAHAGTIAYELLTGLGRRYARRYAGGA